MNKLNKYTNKSIPLYWDNIDWFQQATRDAFEAIMNAIGVDVDGNFILTGCVPSYNPGTHYWSVTEGWVVIGGEILHVQAQYIDVSLGADYIVYEIEETNDPTGTDQDSLGNTIQMHLDRHAKLKIETDPTGQLEMTGPSIMAVIKDAIISESDFANDILGITNTNKTNWTALTGFVNGHIAGSPAPMYRIDSNNMVHFKGEINSESATDQLILNLPDPATPNHTRYIKLIAETGIDDANAIIESNGDFSLFAGYGSAGDRYHLTTIIPYQV